MPTKTAVIIGAGPAGLTAAYELLSRTDYMPVIIEASDRIGGLSCTVEYKGNRMDIGGHRFFSKSDRVMDWWMDILPMQSTGTRIARIAYQGAKRDFTVPQTGPDPTVEDKVMLLRERKSRLYFMRRLFDYPISLSPDTVMKLGIFKTAKIGFSYMRSMAWPIKPEANLEQFFINRFGRELYRTFFKSYTEKVWGVPCQKIDASWGAQRIKGLSIIKAIKHAVRKIVQPMKDVKKKDLETSLIEQFLYPKYGPGQVWETVASIVLSKGAEIHKNFKVKGIEVEGNKIVAINAVNATGEERRFEGDIFFSSMPIKDLIRALQTEVPANVKEVSEGLLYRDFITVGVLVENLKLKDKESANGAKLIKDNWIYIQEPDVFIGRLQIFNNWSPYMVANQSQVWLGLEYFCNDTDDLWRKTDKEMIELGAQELKKIGILDESAQVIDATVIRMPKTYPGYFGTYDRFSELREFLDSYENLHPVGRNGMHRYNNQDHAMLTAMVTVDNLTQGITDKSNVWDVNTEMDYHEEQS
ncbi:MAG: NAD(P)/FAD-dependent oxidoreductase [Candidatus Obscuribacterales bacterium]|nr:NAD(P)/FAD-dependent oxidoreductase [Candidatus Obscuribacterales bacterium]